MSDRFHYELNYQERMAKRKARNRKIKRNIAGGVILLLILAVVTTGAFLILSALDKSGAVATDSGVSACKAMAENVGKNSDSQEWGEPEYQAARMPFESSKHADLKVAGTNLIDTVYKVQKQNLDDADLGTAMVTLQTLQTQWAALQTACANHGQTLPPMPTGGEQTDT